MLAVTSQRLGEVVEGCFVEFLMVLSDPEEEENVFICPEELDVSFCDPDEFLVCPFQSEGIKVDTPAVGGNRTDPTGFLE